MDITKEEIYLYSILHMNIIKSYVPSIYLLFSWEPRKAMVTRGRNNACIGKWERRWREEKMERTREK